jgi:hypothetical protein
MRTSGAATPWADNGHLGQQITHEVVRQRCHEAPGSIAAITSFETGVGVGDDELHAGKAAGDQAV